MTTRDVMQIAGYARPDRSSWGGIVVATIVGSLMTLVQPWPIKVLVDHVLGTSPLPENWGGIGRHTLLLIVVLAGLGVFAVNAASDVVLTRAWVRVGQGMVYRLASDLFSRLQRRSLIYHSRSHVGDTMSRITGDCWCAHTLVDTLLFAPATALVMLAAMLAVMFPMDPVMTLLSLAVAPLMAGGAWLLSGPVGAVARAKRELESRLHSHVQQTLAGISVVQAFAQEQRQRDGYESLTDAAIRLHRRGAFWSAAGELSGGLLTTLGTGLVLLTGGHRVLAGELSLGQLLVFLGYLTTVQTQLRALAGVFPAARTIGASVDRVMQVLSAPPEVSDRADAQPLARAVGHVRFEGVTFGYEPGRPVLREVTMEARPGEVIAIVGQTGAGKSTLAHLIPRLFDPWSGRVIIDGSDASAWRLDDLRRQVAVVMQDSVLFPISIAENIAYGRPDATRDQVIAAARAAEAHGFIDCLPDGYDTVVGERGGTLSGGERQRIAIARALLIDAPILILDEPTSNLDARTERALLGAIERLMAGRTTFIVAHRHSTIRHADQVLLLEKGRVRRLETDRTRALTQRPIVSVEAAT